MAPYLSQSPAGVVVSLKVQPRASRNEVAGTIGDELKIRLTAPPVDSAANLALVDFFADLLGCPRRDVQLLKGQASRHKKLLVCSLSMDQIEKALGKAMGGG